MSSLQAAEQREAQLDAYWAADEIMQNWLLLQEQQLVKARQVMAPLGVQLPGPGFVWESGSG